MNISKKFLFLISFIFILNKSYTIPLFDAYPKLENKIAHINLGEYPSPIIKIDTKKHASQKDINAPDYWEKFSERFRPSLNCKSLYYKDDGYKHSKNIPTGNKMRKLEFLLADAISKGYKTVCTLGGAGSNHALETAVCAKLLGLNSVLILNDQRITSIVIRNLSLMTKVATQIFYADKSLNTNEKLENYGLNFCKKNNYYFIPVGGSNELGTIAFVNAAFELKKQLIDLNIPDPDIIYVTLGSCGTAAGLIIGAAAAGLKSKIIPVRISSTPEEKAKNLVDLINKTVIYLNSLDNNFPKNFATLSGTQIKYPGVDVEINHNFVGAGYADITSQAANSVILFYNLANQILEGTYTGKTLAALISDAERNLLKDKSVLFWNTFSHGYSTNLYANHFFSFDPKYLTPKIFDNVFNCKMFFKQVDYEKLPSELHSYLPPELQDHEVDMIKNLDSYMDFY